MKEETITIFTQKEANGLEVIEFRFWMTSASSYSSWKKERRKSACKHTKTDSMVGGPSYMWFYYTREEIGYVSC